MKFNLKSGLFILSVSLISLNASAQRSKRSASLTSDNRLTEAPAPRVNNPFVGVWELATDGANLTEQNGASAGILKIFGGDGTFTHVQVNRGETRTTHGGTYKIDGKQQYTEFINMAKPDMVYVAPGQVYHLKYSFNGDRTKLTISGTVTNKEGSNMEYTEVWRKL